MELSKVLEKELLEGRFWTHSKTLVEGCLKVSPGCKNCWSEAIAMRFNGGKPFDGTIKEYPDRLLDILPKSGRRAPRVWTYWNDIFHDAVDDELQKRLFSKIKVLNDFHIICTKRPRNAWMFLDECLQAELSNFILLVTIEDQQRINERMPYAMKIAAKRDCKVGLLCEPMLEHLNLCLDIWPVLPKWIICGPENGKGKRPFDADWAASIQMQAAHKGIPFFYKAGLLNGKRYIETP
jgi:protein gp37